MMEKLNTKQGELVDKYLEVLETYLELEDQELAVKKAKLDFLKEIQSEVEAVALGMQLQHMKDQFAMQAAAQASNIIVPNMKMDNIKI